MKRLLFVFLIALAFLQGRNSVYAQGEIWGMTTYGGSSGLGVIFKTAADGSGYTVEHEFQSPSPGEGSHLTRMIQASNGKLYGVAQEGGVFNEGVLFEYDPVTNIYAKKVDFNGTNGSKPCGGLALAPNGKLYGVTSYGGGAGSIYEFDPATGAFTNKFSFSTFGPPPLGGQTLGFEPRGVLTLAPDGNFYGLCNADFVSGTVRIFQYNYTTNTAMAKLDIPMVSSGAPYYESLTLATNGKLYGIISPLGMSNPVGMLIEYDPVTNTYANKHDFNEGDNGATMVAGLTGTSSGKLFGITSGGGSAHSGILFEYDPALELFSKRYDFNSTVSTGFPASDLTELSDGTLVGVTGDSGSGNNGVLYQFNPSTGTVAIKTSFPATNWVNWPSGGNPVTLASNGKLYGLQTQGAIAGELDSYRAGGIFEYDLLTNVYTKKLDLNFSDGSYPMGYLAEINGKFYGTTNFGGSRELGALFEFDPVTKIYTKKIDFDVTNRYPQDGLVSVNGKAYGVSNRTLFEYDAVTNTLTTKHTFTGSWIIYLGPIIVASNGKIYGTLYDRGVDKGRVFEYDPATSAVSMKVEFDGSNNGNIIRVLTEVTPGNLYGMTYETSGNNQPVIFEYNFNTDTFIKKYYFTTTINTGLTNGGNGKLYGVTDGYKLFEYDPATNTYLVKLTLTGSIGYVPVGEMIKSSNGRLYGASTYGGTNNKGTIFEYNIALNSITKKSEFNGFNGYKPIGAFLFTPKVSQTLTFDAISQKTYSDPDFIPNATASSNLPVILSSSDITVATTQGNLIKIVGLGTSIITANQPGDNAWMPAAPLQQTLVVTKATATATANNITKVYGDAIPPLTIAYSGLKAGETGSVIDTPPLTSTTATQLSVPGTYPISITGGADDNYYLNVIGGTLTTIKANQTITFDPLTEKLVGDPNFNLNATASTGLPVTFTSSNPSVATISGNTVAIIASGTTTITATQSGNSNYNAAPDVQQALTVNKGPQIITFNALPAKTYGNAAFSLTATASSGLPVTYTSSDPAVATISGNTVTITGAGETTITASQPGNTHWYAAPDVFQILTVTKASQSITFSALATKIYGDVAFTLTATSTSGLPVSFVSGDPAVATVSGNIVTIVGGGTTTITASQPGSSNYNAASDIAQALTVSQALQSITFNALPAKNYGDAPFAISATATSGLGVVFTSSDPAVATISGNTITITGGGTTTITAVQPGNANYSAALDVPQILTVNKINQTITFSTLAAKTYGNAPYTLAATTTSGLPVTHTSSDPAVLTISGNTVTIVGAGSATITASQPGNANYNAAADVVRTQTVNKANQTITFATPPTKTFTSPSFAFAGTVTSGLPISYAVVDPAVATVSGATCTIVGVGVTQVTATQTGNANYNAAAPITRTLTVNKAAQTITFAAISAKTFGGVPFTLTATTTSGLPISYLSSNTSVISVSGNVATIVGAGSATITASQAGDGNYNAATPVNRAVTVNKASQTITFLTPPAKAYGDAPFILTGTTTSGLTLTYASSNTSVATISGDQVTIVGAGTSNITASQPGNVNYNAAANVVRVLTVAKGNQSIAFDPLTNVQYGDAPFTLNATASSGLGITYISSTPSVATVSGNTVTIVGVGTTTITASQAGNTLYFAAAPVARTLTVNKASQTISFSPLASVQYNDPSFSLTASASSGLPVSFSSSNTSVATVSGATVTIIGIGSAVITASQAGNAVYDVAPIVEQTLTVSKDDQTITFSALPSKIFGDAPFTVSATASSGLVVTFSSSNTSVATVSGTTITIVGAGSATITASQSGSALYNAATPVDQILDVTKMAQTITFGSLTDRVYGDTPFTVSATASSGLAVTFSSTNTAAATVSGNTVTIVGPGIATIVASQPGDANYQSASDIGHNFNITLPAPTEPSSYVDIYNVTSSGMTIEFFPGDGNKRMVIMKPVTPVNFTPVNNDTYAVNYTVNGNVVVMNDAGSLVNVPGLLSDTKYYIKIIEYNEVGSFTSYMTTGATATARTAVGFSGFAASGTQQSSEEGELAVRVLNNPFKTRLSILIETPKEEDALVGLLDLNGKVIHSSTRKTKKQIDIEEPVVNGIYMLRVRTSSKSKMIRVVKMD
jgi:uncharacterized repeat protein (TIGR03803 family)